MTVLRLALLAAVLASPAGARQTCTPDTSALGTVIDLAPGCGGYVPSLPGSTCFRKRIDVPNAQPIRVDILVSEPTTSPVRGTVVLGTGGAGSAFYEADPQGGGDLVASRLLALGFRVVQRRWIGSPTEAYGWFERGDGLVNMSCRYATLLTWIHDEIHVNGVHHAGPHEPGPAFAVSGNSGGAGEIAYALSAWDVADAGSPNHLPIDVAVLTGGPPFTRMDFACLNAGDWPNECPTLVPANVMDCSGSPGIVCFKLLSMPLGSCLACDPTPSDSTLAADSVLHPGAAKDYGDTRVHSIFGTDDCESTGVPFGVLFQDHLLGEKAIQFVEGGQHFVPATAAGRDAIVWAILAGTSTDTVGPATLSPDIWPVEGGSFDIRVHGPDLGRAHVQASIVGTTETELPGLGWYFLDQGVTVIRTLLLDSVGEGVYTAQIPVGSVPVGTEIFLQAVLRDANLIYTGITNLNSVVVR